VGQVSSQRLHSQEKWFFTFIWFHLAPSLKCRTRNPGVNGLLSGNGFDGQSSRRQRRRPWQIPPQPCRPGGLRRMVEISVRRHCITDNCGCPETSPEDIQQRQASLDPPPPPTRGVWLTPRGLGAR
jgi:hypothetical protein